MKAYIKNSTAISPQHSFDEDYPWAETQVYTDRLNCVEPVYKEYFPPMKIRRMSRLVKMALTSAKVCLDKAAVEMPDAIITASGWGCLNDTYKYLGEITSKEEIAPSPATFIQSTHNTPGGQVALTLGCQNYNNVIVNGKTSFEQALLDGLMLINEGKENILVGGFDEIAEADYALKNRAGFWKDAGTNSKEFINVDSEGTLPGEGSAFFTLSSTKQNAIAEVNFCSVVRALPNAGDVKTVLEEALGKENLTLKDIDVICLGANGNSKETPLYNDLKEEVFTDQEIVNFKAYCGEYDTASAFALWLASKMIETQHLPESKTETKIKSVLIYNYAGEDKHALTLISKTS